MIFRDPPKGQRPINAFFKPEYGGGGVQGSGGREGGGVQGSGGRGGGGGKWGPGRGKAPRGGRVQF